MRFTFARLAAAGALVLCSHLASAETYPSRAIHLIVPFAAGGPADLLGRIIADEMSKDFGQQVIVDNRPGANTIIGAQAVAKADPDGYTILMAIDGTLVMNPYLYSKLPYDPFKDFEPVSLIAQVPSVLEANIKVPVDTAKDMIAQEKAKPGSYQVGVSTPTSQVVAALINMMAGINLQMIPYKGGTTQVTGLLAGDIQLGMESLNVALPLALGGKLKILGRDRGEAHLARARHPGHRRNPARIRPRHLAEHRRAGQDAARCGRQAARRVGEAFDQAKRPREIDHSGRRAGDQQIAGRLRRLHPFPSGNAQQGHQGGRPEAGLRTNPMLIAPRLSCAFALAFAAALAPAAAQDAADAKTFPDKPIHMIVPFPAGGPADTIARFLGQKMTEHWNQPVIIENRAGGNTAIGAQAVAKSPADGYTLLVAMDVTMVMNPLLYTNLTYDPAKDLTPITLLTRSMSLIVVRSDGPRTLKELIAKAKANPGKLNMGAGTVTSRLGALAFAQAAGMDVQLDPLQGQRRDHAGAADRQRRFHHRQPVEQPGADPGGKIPAAGEIQQPPAAEYSGYSGSAEHQ